MTHRLLSALAAVVVAVALVVLSAPASLAQDGPSSTGAARRHLPGTTLEADQRDDGNTSAAPWFIGSGLAAIVVVGAGGWMMQRRIERPAPTDPTAGSGSSSRQPR